MTGMTHIHPPAHPPTHRPTHPHIHPSTQLITGSVDEAVKVWDGDLREEGDSMDGALLAIRVWVTLTVMVTVVVAVRYLQLQIGLRV